MTSVFQPGNTAVITGASSGIGRAAAIYCAKQGMNVWMVDIDAEELALALEVVNSGCSDSLKCANSEVISRVVDVANEEAMKALSVEVFSRTGGVCHFLMNNAGVGMGGNAFTDMDTVTKVIGINTYGPIHGCLHFVPTMKKMNTESLVVNTGSKQGITMPPGNLVYNMSKAALKCYTEGLAHELRETMVKVALLVPGWVNTSILLKSLKAKAQVEGEEFNVENVFFYEDKPAAGAWMPHQVIEYMVQKLNQGSFYIICPDNDVDTETDRLRMTWTMQDITEDRPPLSRWHPDYKDKFDQFIKSNGK
jgi:NAD(P)-dependent dehydrogenase (short-subunit alcohol dehydrogenase family)